MLGFSLEEWKRKVVFLHSPLHPRRPLRQTNRKSRIRKKNEREKAFIFFLFLFLPLCNSFHQKKKDWKNKKTSWVRDSKVIFSTVAFHTPNLTHPYPRTRLLLNTQFILYFFANTPTFGMSYNIYYVTCSSFLFLVSFHFFGFCEKFIPVPSNCRVFSLSVCCIGISFQEFPCTSTNISHFVLYKYLPLYLFVLSLYLTVLNYSRHESAHRSSRLSSSLHPSFSSRGVILQKVSFSSFINFFHIVFFSLSLYKWDPMTCRSFGTCPSSSLLLVKRE